MKFLTGWNILLILGSEEGMQVEQVAQLANQGQTAISRRLEQLEKWGLAGRSAESPGKWVRTCEIVGGKKIRIDGVYGGTFAPAWNLLLELQFDDPITATDLERPTGRHGKNLVESLQRLEKLGLVRSEMIEVDRKFRSYMALGWTRTVSIYGPKINWHHPIPHRPAVGRWACGESCSE